MAVLWLSKDKKKIEKTGISGGEKKKTTQKKLPVERQNYG